MWLTLAWIAEGLDWFIDRAAHSPVDAPVREVHALTVHLARGSHGLWSAAVTEAPWAAVMGAPTPWLAIGEAIASLAE